MQHDIHAAMVYFARDGSLYDRPVAVTGWPNDLNLFTVREAGPWFRLSRSKT
jgi:hypothetical protein